ncbi:YcaO-like family protein [Mesorhizobium sp. M0408]|uniref:YcaO-like family protein n=1 Tax=Mesorhizobium sp. M0408 TaxID=2956942 RepID=UPI00333A01EC
MPPIDGSTTLVSQFVNIPHPPGCPFYVAAAVLTLDRTGRRRVVSGRARTRDEAISRTLMEAAERTRAIYRGDEEFTIGALSELGDVAIDPRLLVLCSDLQLAQAELWNARVEKDHWIPQRFNTSRAIPWLKALDASTGAPKYAPAPYCLLSFPGCHELGFCIPDSSGLAAGLTYEQATLRGVLELVERDAVSIWWYNRLTLPPVAVPDNQEELVALFRSWLDGLGRELRLIDLTNDLGIPVVAAVACSKGGSGFWFGSAAGTDLGDGIEGALGELCQFMVSACLPHCVPTRQPLALPDFVSWAATAPLAVNEHLCPSGEPRAATGTLTLDQGLAKLKTNAIDVSVVNLSGAEIGTTVVRVLAPSLRPIWPRFASGRLFDVPVRMGWRNNVILERDLNPTPILY